MRYGTIYRKDGKIHMENFKYMCGEQTKAISLIVDNFNSTYDARKKIQLI